MFVVAGGGASGEPEFAERGVRDGAGRRGQRDPVATGDDGVIEVAHAVAGGEVPGV